MDHGRLAALDLNLLVVLDALLDERSVGGAGRRVGLSQPAVSRALARLREQLGDPLLVRSGRAMLRTPRADAVAPVVRRLLQATAAVFEPPAAFDPARSARRFAIAATDYAERALLVPTLPALRAEAPGISFVIRPAATREIPGAETGDIDLGIVFLRGDAPGLSRRRLWADPYVLAFRPGHPRVRGPVTKASYLKLEHVLVSPDGHGATSIDDALAGERLQRAVGYRTLSFASALATAARSDLVATVPARALTLFAEGAALHHYPLPFAPPCTIYLVRHERYAEEPALAWLAERLAQAAQGLCAPPVRRARPAPTP